MKKTKQTIVRNSIFISEHLQKITQRKARTTENIKYTATYS